MSASSLICSNRLKGISSTSGTISKGLLEGVSSLSIYFRSFCGTKRFQAAASAAAQAAAQAAASANPAATADWATAAAACTTVAEHPLIPNGQREPIRGRAGATALHRLENRTLLVAEWKASDTGRDAKFYSLTGNALVDPNLNAPD